MPSTWTWPDLLKRLKKLAKDPDMEPTLRVAFDHALDDLRANDFFGTEGQNDPRGDPRP